MESNTPSSSKLVSLADTSEPEATAVAAEGYSTSVRFATASDGCRPTPFDTSQILLYTILVGLQTGSIESVKAASSLAQGRKPGANVAGIHRPGLVKGSTTCARQAHGESRSVAVSTAQPGTGDIIASWASLSRRPLHPQSRERGAAASSCQAELMLR